MANCGRFKLLSHTVDYDTQMMERMYGNRSKCDWKIGIDFSCGTNNRDCHRNNTQDKKRRETNSIHGECWKIEFPFFFRLDLLCCVVMHEKPWNLLYMLCSRFILNMDTFKRKLYVKFNFHEIGISKDKRIDWDSIFLSTHAYLLPCPLPSPYRTGVHIQTITNRWNREREAAGGRKGDRWNRAPVWLFGTINK